MISEHFLYSTIIEGDGHLRKEPTLAGCALIIIAFAAFSAFVLVALA